MQDSRIRLALGSTMIVAVLVMIFTIRDIPSPNFVVNPPMSSIGSSSQGIDVSDQVTSSSNSNMPAGIFVDAITLSPDGELVESEEFTYLRIPVSKKVKYSFNLPGVTELSIQILYDSQSLAQGANLNLAGKNYQLTEAEVESGEEGIATLSVNALVDKTSHDITIQPIGGYLDLFAVSITPVN